MNKRERYLEEVGMSKEIAEDVVQPMRPDMNIMSLGVQGQAMAALVGGYLRMGAQFEDQGIVYGTHVHAPHRQGAIPLPFYIEDISGEYVADAVQRDQQTEHRKAIRIHSSVNAPTLAVYTTDSQNPLVSEIGVSIEHVTSAAYDKVTFVYHKAQPAAVVFENTREEVHGDILTKTQKKVSGLFQDQTVHRLMLVNSFEAANPLFADMGRVVHRINQLMHGTEHDFPAVLIEEHQRNLARAIYLLLQKTAVKMEQAKAAEFLRKQLLEGKTLYDVMQDMGAEDKVVALAAQAYEKIDPAKPINVEAMAIKGDDGFVLLGTTSSGNARGLKKQWNKQMDRFVERRVEDWDSVMEQAMEYWDSILPNLIALLEPDF